MKGKISITIRNRHIVFRMKLERNVTIITGDSGTGKTKLINMVRDYAELGKSSGVTLTCKKPCIVLSGQNWRNNLEQTHESIVFVEESTQFLVSHDFAKAIINSDNYYVLVTREPLPQIPYSIDAIKQINKNGSKPKIGKIYENISVRDINKFPYDIMITEDSKAGFQMFNAFAKKVGISCISANGKSNIIDLLYKNKMKNILVIADAAALGSEIRELIKYKKLSEKRVDFFLPESFEWLILKSAIFNGNIEVKEILDDPVEFIESSEYFSWERFFTYLLVDQTKDNPKLNYPANKSKLPSGYLTDSNVESIVNAMKK